MKTIDICGVPFTVQVVDPSHLEDPDDGGGLGATPSKPRSTWA